MQIRRGLYVLLINVLVVIVILLLFEGLSRILVTDEHAPYFSDRDLRIRGRPFVEHDPVKGFSLKPLFKNSLYSVNSAGFRGTEFPSDLSGKFLIVALGESTTFGWKVRNGEDYPSYLMNLLASEYKDAYVINGGVPSYSSAQVLRYLEEVLNTIHPDLILISIMWNDIWYSTISSWDPDILIYQTPADWKIFLLRYSKLVRALWSTNTGRNKARVDLFNERALQEYTKNIARMIQLCKENDTSLVFISPPFNADRMPEEGLMEFHVRYSKAFFTEVANRFLREKKKLARKHGVPVVKHRLSLENSTQFALFLDPLHPTPEGNLHMAEDIFRYLRDSQLIKK